MTLMMKWWKEGGWSWHEAQPSSEVWLRSAGWTRMCCYQRPQLHKLDLQTLLIAGRDKVGLLLWISLSLCPAILGVMWAFWCSSICSQRQNEYV